MRTGAAPLLRERCRVKGRRRPPHNGAEMAAAGAAVPVSQRPRPRRLRPRSRLPPSLFPSPSEPERGVSGARGWGGVVELGRGAGDRGARALGAACW